jgi:hypothetical protein
MIRMGSRQLLLVLSVLLSMLGCKEKEPPLINVQQAMLPYCWFPNGGYWVYQEESTPGWTDSMYSTGESNIYTIPDAYGDGFESQVYFLGYVFRGEQLGQNIIGKAYGPDFEHSYSVLREVYSDSVGDLRDIVFFWDVNSPDTCAYDYRVTVKQRLDSIVIFGKTYYDIIEIETNPPQIANHTYEIVWARNVGVVRRVMVDGTSWSLLRHQIY